MAKSTEEKIKEIFLRKLAVKIQGIKLEIAESLYLQYLFDDIVLLAEAEMNLELAIEKKYESIKEENPDLDLDKKIIDETLRSVLAEYKSEIEVYNDYFSKKNNPKILKRQLYTEILKKLNDEPKHLTARLHEILRYHLSPMVENVDTDKMGLSKEDLLFLIAYQIENLARYSDAEDCARVELSEGNYSEDEFERLVDITKNRYIQFEPSVKKQIEAYKKAIEDYSEGKEIYYIIEEFKKNLNK